MKSVKAPSLSSIKSFRNSFDTDENLNPAADNFVSFINKKKAKRPSILNENIRKSGTQLTEKIDANEIRLKEVIAKLKDKLMCLCFGLGGTQGCKKPMEHVFVFFLWSRGYKM